MLQRTTKGRKTNTHKGNISAFLFVLLFMIGTFIIPYNTYSQDTQQIGDTVLKKPHSPTKAAIFSAVLPGLGQGYNKKYWKIPIVYAGFGVITYFVINNSRQYKDFKEAYTYVASGDSGYIDNDLVGKYDEQQLLDGKNYYRRNMELSYIVGALWYVLNIIDASVDAHFFDYDVSEDLTIRVDPVMHMRRQDFRPVTGVRLTVNF